MLAVPDNFYARAIDVASMQHAGAMVLRVGRVTHSSVHYLLMTIIINADCPSMEDEQGCSGSTPSFCRADQFRCGTTCIPNVSYDDVLIY